MPVTHGTEPHREKIVPPSGLRHGFVAQAISPKVASTLPEALKARDDEMSKLRVADKGKGTWDESKVMEYGDAIKAARSSNLKFNCGRFFLWCIP